MNSAIQMPEEGMSYEEFTNFVAEQFKRMNLVLKNIDGLNIVDIKFELQGGAYIQLNRKGLVFFDGTNKTFTVDINGKATLTGADIQTVDGSYPSVSLSGSGNQLKASKSETEYIAINPGLTGSPTLSFETPTSKGYIYPDSISGQFSLLATVGNMALNAQSGRLSLAADGDIRLTPGPGKKVVISTGYTGTFSTGTKTVEVTNGIITDVY